VHKAAIEEAFHDGRFSPLRENELNKIVFEVSILDLPKEIEGLPDKKIDKIKKGDGLILECGIRKGLFLPQVWEQLPDKKEFLEALCWKAGLTPDYILDKDIKLYKFSVKAYKESKPKGTVIKIKF
jgi:AmmeMemoRadiSam system protein A